MVQEEEESRRRENVKRETHIVAKKRVEKQKSSSRSMPAVLNVLTSLET